MEIKITAQVENQLLGRREVRFTLRHDGETTPNRAQVRQLVASELGTKTENVVIDNMHSSYGMGATQGVARAYKTADAARQTERTHLLKRNSLYVEKAKKAGSEGDKKDDKAAAKPAEKPAEKPAAPKKKEA